MNRYQNNRSSRQGRYDRDYSRRAEQWPEHFSDDDYRGHGQFGDDYRLDDYDDLAHDSWRDRDDRFAAHRGQGFGRQGQNRNQHRNQSRSRDWGPRGDYSAGGYGSDDYPSGRSSPGRYGPSHYAGSGQRGFASFNSNDYGGGDFSGPRYNYGPGRSPYPAHGPYGGGNYGEGSYGSAPSRDWNDRDDTSNERGFFDRASDEVASWFGDRDAARRRKQDHRGSGPANYKRSDERILEDACDRLTEDWAVDARNTQVTVLNGEVTLDGTVADRNQKRRAEDCVNDISGVTHVQNNLRVEPLTSRNRGSESSAIETDGKSGTLA